MQKKSKRQSGNTNLASEFYVASQLFRLGYEVTITLGHTKEIDLIVINPTNGKTITIDVKGLKNKSNWPLTPQLIKREDHFYVLVNYCNKFNDPNFLPEVYVIPSDEIENLLEHWTKRGKKPIEKTCINYRNPNLRKYNNNWELISKQLK
jgi:transposase-like protein